MTRRARTEASTPPRDDESGQFQTVSAEHAEVLGHAVEAFKSGFPDDWGMIRTWPTESGLIHIAEKLKG